MQAARRPTTALALHADAARRHADAPVGVFDSGLGGLSVLRAIRAALPHEPLLYLADSRYAPYGPRDDDFIADRALAIGTWLVERGAKALVVACNTATAQSAQLLRERLDVPIVGVEPGIKPAALASKTRVAGVLATASTLNSARFAALLARHGRDCRFICQPGHGLVDAIEAGDTESPALRALLARYLSPMLAQCADTLVLGCTHYPFLSDMLREIAGERLHVIDTSIAIARQLERLLDAHALRATPPSALSLSPSAPSPISVVLASTGGGTRGNCSASIRPPNTS
jgi:glutamate racemase